MQASKTDKAVSSGPEEHPSLAQLPSELLEIIIELVHQDANECAQSLWPLSMTCRRLRDLTKPVLFYAKSLEYYTIYGRDDGDHGRACMNLSGKRGIGSVAEESILSCIRELSIAYWDRHWNYHPTWVKHRHCNAYIVDRIDHMTNLRIIRFDSPSWNSAFILQAMIHRPLHIILDAVGAPRVDKTESAELHDEWNKLAHIADWQWSIATRHGRLGTPTIPIILSPRLVALEWSHPGHTTRAETSRYKSLLTDVYGSPLLEELHVSEIRLERTNYIPSCSPYIGRLLTSLPSLRRLRVEGRLLCHGTLEIVGELNSLEDLSIYSSYRSVFHPNCDGDGHDSQMIPPPEAMPWLQLPKLKRLDIRFVCQHCTIQQLVPKGLTALRLEFYEADKHLAAHELRWLAHNCPGLQRLELDVGELSTADTVDDISLHAERLLRCLQPCRNLRTLRLFSNYWHEGRLRPNPLPHANLDPSSVAVQIYYRLLSMFHSLRTLHITISFGEYPFDIIQGMEMEKRPIKFEVKAVGSHDAVVLKQCYAQSGYFQQQTYKKGAAVSDLVEIPMPASSFFDDLSDGWTLPHYEIHTINDETFFTHRERHFRRLCDD